VPAEESKSFPLHTNSNATYGADCGQVSLVTGANNAYQALLWFDQNESSMRTLDYKSQRIPRQRLRDNRFGEQQAVRTPHKTFSSANYEGRRLPQTAPVTRIGFHPIRSDRVLEIVDGSGTVRQLHDAELRSAAHRLSPSYRIFGTGFQKQRPPRLATANTSDSRPWRRRR